VSAASLWPWRTTATSSWATAGSACRRASPTPGRWRSPAPRRSTRTASASESACAHWHKLTSTWHRSRAGHDFACLAVAAGMARSVTSGHAPATRTTRTPVSRAFPSWSRSILAEIYLCRACSCQEILRIWKRPGRWPCYAPGGGLGYGPLHAHAATAAAGRRGRRLSRDAGLSAWAMYYVVVDAH
jgi:hypothetical protein